jgi:hypothetical protein
LNIEELFFILFFLFILIFLKGRGERRGEFGFRFSICWTPADQLSNVGGGLIVEQHKAGG